MNRISILNAVDIIGDYLREEKEELDRMRSEVTAGEPLPREVVRRQVRCVALDIAVDTLNEVVRADIARESVR